MKFQLEGEKAEDLQKFSGKPNRKESNAGSKIQSTDEKIRSALRISFNGGLITLINSKPLTNKNAARQGLKI